MNGFVVYEGPSRLDGAPVVAIITTRSFNAKTGDIPQAWILRSDIAPNEAVRSGADRAICGDCVHRSGGALGRSCYVIFWLGPMNVYKAYRAGMYPRVSPREAAEQLAGEPLRLSAYGDATAVPREVWTPILRQAGKLAAYTHQWRTCDQGFRPFLMASVESEREADEAHALGWRTFRTRLWNERVRSDEIVCPASTEARHRVTCAVCGLCSGGQRASARSIVIQAHGQRVRWFTEQKRAAS